MRCRRAASAVVIVAVVALSACGQQLRNMASPTCNDEFGGTLALFAQAVPSAERVPCIASFPAGWRYTTFRARSGSARFRLSSDRAVDRAVTVELKKDCDVSGATEIASDEAGTRRYERVRKVVGGLSGTRYYVFSGGCVTYDVDFAEHGSALVNELSVAVGFITREAVDELIQKNSDGVERLSPRD